MYYFVNVERRPKEQVNISCRAVINAVFISNFTISWSFLVFIKRCDQVYDSYSRFAPETPLVTGIG